MYTRRTTIDDINLLSLTFLKIVIVNSPLVSLRSVFRLQENYFIFISTSACNKQLKKFCKSFFLLTKSVDKVFVKCGGIRIFGLNNIGIKHGFPCINVC